MTSNPAVSAVIPVYNEFPALAETVERADRALRESPGAGRYEIILVDDGSTDGALESAVLPEAARAVRHGANRGYGAALKTGIRQARYPLILICDADGSYALEALPRLLAAWTPSRMIVADRDVIVYVSAAWIKRLMRRLFQGWLFLLTFRLIRDVNSGFRLFERERALPALDDLSDRFSFTTGLTLHWIFSGEALVYVPTPYALRRGESKVRFLTDSARVFAQTVRFTLKRRPARLGIPAAGVLAAGWAAWRSFGP